jgi:zinc D-Ala-D-Ala carboxypeptidase
MEQKMKLSPHFTLAELTASNMAQQRGIDNTPPDELIPRMMLLAELLERVRTELAVPVTITSGYRCQQLNMAVGGVTSSDHTQGHAADIVAPAFGTPHQIAKLLAPLVAELGIGQLILEGIKGKQWVHISTHTPERQSNRVITITDAGARLGIQVLA